MKTFAILALIATALAAPAGQGCGNAAAPATGKAGGVAAGGAAAGGAASCAAAKTQLESGIQANLDIQAQELAGVQSLQKQVGTAAFKDTQAKVLKIQQQGIDIRANNQKLAAQINSPAIAGLKTVQGAQVQEMTQVMGLQNSAATDDATLTTLVQEVQDGTKQNQKNLDAAKSTTC